jgi:signal transduction histidine kinase
VSAHFPSALRGLLFLRRDAATGTVSIRDAEGSPVAAELDAGIGRVFAGGSGVEAVRLTAAGGAATTLLVRCVPGEHDLAVAIPDDDSERRLAPIVETVVNQIAHDTRNFAFTIGLQAELGERRSESAPEVKAHFTAVLRQIDALKGFIDRLLLYGRPMAPRPAPLDLAALVRLQVQSLGLSWKPDAPPPDVRVEIADDVGEVRWDARLIGHALLALLDNAARSADPAPPVTVRATRSGEGVTVEVTDRGAGIAPENVKLLALPMRVRRHGGLGLGLAVARKVAAAHGGALDLTTGAGGTTVRLSLPREVPAA